MKKRKSKNEKLDRIGRNLLESARFRDEAIEKIIAAPQLFSLVKARIEEQKIQQTAGSPFFLWLNWPKIRFSFGASAILLVGIIGFSVFENLNSSQGFATAEVVTPEIQLPNAMTENLVVSLGTIESLRSKRSLNRQTNFKKETVKSSKSAVKTNKPEKIKEIEEEKEFYPLTFVGDLEDFQADAQIVRVELTRSAVMSLGVSPPAENLAEKIKTELLIGSDGVTRGIRFVE